MREIAESEPCGERVASTGRIHDVLHLDAVDELSHGGPGAAPIEHGASTLVQGHADGADAAVQAMRRQVAQLLVAQRRRVTGDLGRLTEPRRARLLEVHLQDVDVGKPHVPVRPDPGCRSPLRVSVVVGPCASRTTVPLPLSLMCRSVGWPTS